MYLRKLPALVAVVAIVALTLVATTATAASVTPVFIAGNPQCSDYGLIEVAYANNGDSGTYGPVTVTKNGSLFSWSSTLGIDLVLVKGGPNANGYFYDETFDDPSAESFGDTDLHAPTNPRNGNYYGLSHVSFCADYELDISKTATTSYTRQFDWTVTKSVNNDILHLFRGESGSVQYTVEVTKSAPIDYDFVVSGSIFIENNSPLSATITSVSDVISGYGAVTANCGVSFPHVLVPGASLTCSYSAGPEATNTFGSLNTVTVVTSGDVGGGVATANVAFGDPTTVLDNSASVSDTYAGGPDETISSSKTYTYSRTFTCDADEGLKENTATVTESDSGDSDSDDADVTINCYALTVTKDATPTFTRTYTWDIDKSVDVAQHDLFNGQSGTSNYSVEVDQTVTDSAWAVKGNIVVSNPAPMAATLTSVSDVISGGITASVNCPSLVVPAGGTLECTYESDLPNADSRTNTATAVAYGVSYSGNAAVNFSGVNPTVVGYPTINVTDSVEGALGSAGGDKTFSYSRTFTCGADEGEHPNIATIDETGQQDNASVDVNCYALTVTKTATPSFTRTYTWDIDKEFSAHYDLFVGQSVNHNYTVSVMQYVSDGSWAVSGGITVSNPAPMAATLTSVSDVISGGITASVSCPALAVPAGGSLNCTYSASLPDGSSRTNTATAVAYGVSYSGNAAVDFSGVSPTIVGYPTVTVTDSVQGGLGSFSGSGSTGYSRTFTCDSAGNFEYPNTATIDQTGQNDSALVTLTCTGQPEWCSPGYWKNHTDNWPIDPNTSYNSIFDPDLEGDPSLLDVISQPEVYGGERTNQVGDYLSSIDPRINFTGERADNCPLN